MDVMTLLLAAKNGNIDKLYDQMIKTNPKFKKFVDENKDKSTDELAKQYGIDPSLLNGFK